MTIMLKHVEKPWGCEEWWAWTKSYVGKVLKIKKGHRLSLQYHEVKDETMIVLKGTLTLTYGDEVRTLHAGQNVHIPPGTIHRLEARDEDVEVVEVSTPEVDDVVRVSDDYSRSS